MAKLSKTLSGPQIVENASTAKTVVRDVTTGRSVTVQGFGALKHSDFKLKKGVNLLKPVARQVLARSLHAHDVD